MVDVVVTHTLEVADVVVEHTLEVVDVIVVYLTEVVVEHDQFPGVLSVHIMIEKKR